jgi:hypothetical protein
MSANHKKERNDSIKNDRDSGMTFIEISEKYGIGPVRARQIYLREKRKNLDCLFHEIKNDKITANDIFKIISDNYWPNHWKSRHLSAFGKVEITVEDLQKFAFLAAKTNLLEKL